MQLYVSDYLADTAHLTAQQHGAYMLLLMNYWQRGKALDNHNDRLAHVARLSPEQWADDKEILAEFFDVDENGIWWHSRIENDLEKVREKSVKASTAGKRSFSVRSTGVEHSLNHKDKDKEEDKDKEQKPSSNEFDEFWLVYPRKVGKQEAEKAFAKAIKVAPASEIISGAQKYAKDPNRVPTFTAHPSTWLNQGRWSDDPLPPRTVENGFRSLNTTPTVQPPRFDPEEAAERALRAIPMPEGVKEVLNRIRTMSDLP